MAGFTRDEAKLAAALRAQRSLEKAFEQIDWIHDVYRPTLAKFRAGELRMSGDPLLAIEEAKDASAGE